MERKSSKQYLVVFSVEGEKSNYEFAIEDSSQVVGSAPLVLLRTGQHNARVHRINGSGPEAKRSRASVFWFFLPTTMFFAAVGTHFPKKNTRVNVTQ